MIRILLLSIFQVFGLTHGEHALALSKAFRLDCRVMRAMEPVFIPNLDQTNHVEFDLRGLESKFIFPDRKTIPIGMKGAHGRYEIQFPNSRVPSILQLDGDPFSLPMKIRFQGTLVSLTRVHGLITLDCFSFR